MTDKHHCCQCATELKEALKENKRATQKLSRDLKTAQRRIQRLKVQKQKLLQTKKQAKIKKLNPSFFRST